MPARTSRWAVKAGQPAVYYAPKLGFAYSEAATFAEFLDDEQPEIVGLARTRGHELRNPVPMLLGWWQRHRHLAAAARVSDGGSVLESIGAGPPGVAQPGGGMISGASTGTGTPDA